MIFRVRHLVRLSYLLLLLFFCTLFRSATSVPSHRQPFHSAVPNGDDLRFHQPRVPAHDWVLLPLDRLALPGSQRDGQNAESVMLRQELRGPVLDGLIRQEFVNQTAEPLAVPDRRPFFQTPGETVTRFVDFFLNSTVLGFPQRMADFMVVLLAAETSTREENWRLFNVLLAEDQSYHVFYIVLINEGTRNEFQQAWQTYINRTQFEMELLPRFGNNIANLTVNLTVSSDLQTRNPPPFFTPEPSALENVSGSRTTLIWGTVVGVVLLLVFAGVVVRMIPRTGGGGNDGPNMARRRRFLRWVDTAEVENENPTTASIDLENPSTEAPTTSAPPTTSDVPHVSTIGGSSEGVSS